MMVTTITFLGSMGLFISVTNIALTIDTITRLAVFFGITIVYMAIFLAIGLLLSIVLPSPSTSLLASVIAWLASIQLIPNVGYAIGQILYPVKMSVTSAGAPSFTQQTGFTTIRTIISAASPSTSYESIINSVLTSSSMEFTSGTVTVKSIDVLTALYLRLAKHPILRRPDDRPLRGGVCHLHAPGDQVTLNDFAEENKHDPRGYWLSR